MMVSNSIKRLAPSPDDPPHIVKGRARLVKAATKLFREKSYHSTSVGDVAREAEISVGAVYLYIKTKSDLLVLLFNDVVEEYKSRVYLINELDGTASARLETAIREYYSVLDKHHAKTEIMYHEYGAMEPEARAYIRQVEDDLESVVYKILISGIETGEFVAVDARLYARNMLWLGHMWALNRGGVRSSMTVDKFIAGQVDFFMRALAA
jgi:AcrR family transcriptional regulator